KLRPLSKKLGKKRLLEEQWMKLEDPNLTPSAKLLRCIENKGYVAAALFLAKRHKKALLEAPLSPSRQKQLEEVSADSLIENRRLESASKILTPEYEDLELSTQIVIKKALERGVSVEVLDREDQLLRLSREGHVEYIKEATKTSKDTYITPYLLENKEVTKRLLFEKGLFVPLGKVYTSEKMAVENYSRFENIKIVVKPKATNMGVGITFVKPHEPSSFAAAVYAAFRHGSSVVVEPFCEGEEYRFLIIDQELIAVAQRLPAHVIGDGKRTIRELVKAKNHDPDYYREPKCHLILSEVEKNCLKKQRLSPASIPKKGKQVFLRENSNVSTGGDAIDVTDDLHSGYGRIAIEAAQTFEAKICGVDMMIVSAHEAPTPKNYAIVELNYNPVLFIHAHPFKGKARDVAGPLLDLLGFTIP
ncbi:MAG: bifunctional glutamate--cysteine ligase GshA/glutathione synthetase GshB, partial [Chlamydiia bacterium]|nr:bifunctional glutamate--cysteine ligase GshA/glutathione synthetase GshB [Chlamydiia bacterium]